MALISSPSTSADSGMTAPVTAAPMMATEMRKTSPQVAYRNSCRNGTDGFTAAFFSASAPFPSEGVTFFVLSLGGDDAAGGGAGDSETGITASVDLAAD